MISRRIRRSLVAAFIVAALADVSVADDRVRVTLDEAPTLAAGESATLHVRVEDVGAGGLAAFQLTIAYDPAIASVGDPNAAFAAAGLDAFAPLGGLSICAPVRGESACHDAPWLLTSTGRSALGRAEIDASSGRVQIAYGSSGASAPATGDGAIAIIQVTSVSGDPIELSLEKVVLTDASDPPRVHPLAGASSAESN